MITREGKQSIIIHSLAFVCFVGLLVLATFKDLDISKALSNGDSFFGQFFAVFAEWPAYIITPFAGVILFYNVDNMTKDRKKALALKVVFAIVHYVGWFMFFNHSEQYDTMANRVLMSLGYTAILATGTLYFSKFISKDLVRRLLKFAVFALTVMLVSRIIVTVMKVCWSRARFRDMLAVGSFDTFTPWYQPNGIRKIEGFELTSFPSGHVTSAANIFVIVVLADILPSLKNKKTLLYIISALFTGLAMIARVVYNAHFFSDTLVACFISYLSFYIVKAIFFKDKKYVYDLKGDSIENVEAKDNDIKDNKDNIDITL